MRGLRQRLFAIYVFIAIVQAAVADFNPKVSCLVCNGYHICGLKGSNLPRCFNGHPCTREQYRFCVKMIKGNPNGRCDRPGIFPDPSNSTSYYRCAIKKNDLRMVKLPLRCSFNTSFDATTMLCLTEEERNNLKAIELRPGRMSSTEETFHCKSYGVFSDPQDCKKYHQCDSKLQAQDFYCPVGTYFFNATCGVTKTKECVTQLIKQSNKQIKEAHRRYRHLQQVMSRNLSRVNDLSPALQDRVIKNGFNGIAGMRYRIYGIGENSHAETLADTQETLSNVEKIIENIITKYVGIESDTYDLLELQADIQNATISALNNTRQVQLKWKIKPCKTNEESSNIHQTDQKSLKITVIIITAITPKTKNINPLTTTDTMIPAYKGTTTEKMTATTAKASSAESFLTSKTKPTEEPTSFTYLDAITTETKFPDKNQGEAPIKAENSLKHKPVPFPVPINKTHIVQSFVTNPSLTSKVAEETKFIIPQTTQSSKVLTTLSTHDDTAVESTTTTPQTAPTEKSSTSSTYEDKRAESTPATSQATPTEEVSTYPIYEDTTAESMPTIPQTTPTEEVSTYPIYEDTTAESSPVTSQATPTEEVSTYPIYEDTTAESMPTIPQTTPTEEVSTYPIYEDTTAESSPVTSQAIATEKSSTSSTYEDKRAESMPTIPQTTPTEEVSTYPIYEDTTVESTPATFQTTPAYKTNAFTTAWVMTSTESTTSAIRKPFRCPHVGFFRDRNDCHSFYRCRRVRVIDWMCPNCVAGRWKIVATHHTCKNGLWFSNFFWKCVKSKPLKC